VGSKEVTSDWLLPTVSITVSISLSVRFKRDRREAGAKLNITIFLAGIFNITARMFVIVPWNKGMLAAAIPIPPITWVTRIFVAPVDGPIVEGGEGEAVGLLGDTVGVKMFTWIYSDKRVINTIRYKKYKLAKKYKYRGKKILKI
jgi:hypothetical protein